ncbi:hypothetical protein CXZ13_16685 (plasmid) [Lactiplantibacillus plantarum]|uniref:hypothetical protein n=1 Tax=Lactiplantibacillus plantarum TaxID=1590 RepID=UPI000CA254D7|nr:hypothetical protein [Lactiplantibacillus plantarum]AUH38847.1 hypothetical protein CXZ13_16685 [Lactiplantibacillus plantarum]
MSKALDIPSLKQRLAQAEQELDNKIGHDMVVKQGMETFSAYQKLNLSFNLVFRPHRDRLYSASVWATSAW